MQHDVLRPWAAVSGGRGSAPWWWTRRSTSAGIRSWIHPRKR